MKFTLSFKTPDVMDQIDDDLTEEQQAEVQATTEKFLTYGEYINVEFDTELKTATVEG